VSSNANYSNPPKPKTNEALASIFISNGGPLNSRNDAVNALMKLMPCHSFGRHAHNKDMEKGESKKATLAKYKFHFAFENSDNEDYVTEKVYHALYAGTVPVYLGAPNIDMFVPSNHSIIKVKDFESYEKLAEYLLYLDKHDDEYQEYLEWKNHEFSENFRKLREYIYYEGRCKLCMKLNGMPLPKLDLKRL